MDKYSKGEEICQENDIEFNRRLKFFINNTPTLPGTFFDSLAWLEGGFTCAKEFKTRNSDLKSKIVEDGYIYIELGKLEKLQKLWGKYRILPCYINYIGDWKEVYIFFIPFLSAEDMKVVDGYYDEVDGVWYTRLGLNIRKAFHYVYNEKTGNYDISTPENWKDKWSTLDIIKSDVIKEPLNEKSFFRTYARYKRNKEKD